MGEVRIGDLLFDGAGTPCRVIACSPVMVDRPCFRVTFSDGASIIADAEHRWHTFTVAERSALSRRTEGFRARRRATRARRGSGKRPDLAARNAAEHHGMQPPPTGAVRTTAEIAGTVTLGVRANHSVTVAGPINLPPAELPIPPYILGAWLGDGTSSGAGFTCHDAEILAEVEREGYRPRPQNAPGAYGILGLRAQLRLASLLGNKHIPATYLRASTSQRLALLQGLMDTDGYADARGQCEISLTNHALTEGVLELVRSLGIKATIREGRATLDGRVIGPKWRVKFITDLPAFRLPRKVDRQKRSGFRGTHALRYITAVEPVESVPVRCVAVDSPSRLYLAGREMIPTHNTDLLLGIAGTQHRRSIIFRRVFPSLAAVIDRSKELFSEAGVYNVTHSRWALAAGPSIEFASVQLESDLRKYQGQPHDLVAVDECTEFPEKFVRFLSGWNRTTTPGQRCRVVMTFNPPTDSDGEWVIRYFAPWVDDEHPDPAKDGELRWYAMVDGETGKAVEREFKRREDVPAGVLAQSRTFFHAFLSDNPILEQTGYGATIDALPEPLRSILRGQFDAARQEDPWQVIPIAWVRAAQARWEAGPQPDLPLSCIGVDVARGGADQTVLARCYGHWFGPLEKHPGKSTPDGESVAGLVVRANPGSAVPIHVDVIGVGASAYDSLRKTFSATRGVNFGEGTDGRDRSGQLGFANVRAECFWRLREALDPNTGDGICLPPDPELRADLCAPHWQPRSGKIVVESKEDIAKRLHRSTDCGDAVALTCAPAAPQPRRASFLSGRERPA